MPLLEVRGLTAGYGDAVVLEDVSLVIEEGQGLAILGRNGVGKTTLMLALMGHARRFEGELSFAGSSFVHLAPSERVPMGLGWVPQERDIFLSLTVEENLLVAQRKGRFDLDEVYALFPRLQRTPPQHGGQAFGRRAADARDRPHADDQSAPAAARRAVRGAGARHRRGDRGDPARAAARARFRRRDRRAACRRCVAAERPSRSFWIAGGSCSRGRCRRYC